MGSTPAILVTSCVGLANGDIWEDVWLQPGETWHHHYEEIVGEHFSTWVWFEWETEASVHTTIDTIGSVHLDPGEIVTSHVHSNRPFENSIWLSNAAGGGIHFNDLVDTRPFEAWTEYANTSNESEWWDLQHTVSIWETFTVLESLHIHEEYWLVDFTSIDIWVENAGNEEIHFTFHKSIVPEPGCFLLLSMGCIALATKRRRF